MTPLRLRKVVRDVWATRTRVAMMVVAIAVSVVAVGAFLSARAILGREISRNYLDTHPASATLVVPGGVDPAWVSGTPGVRDAAARTSLLARVRVGDGPWRVLMLFVNAPGDPGRIGVVAPPGARPDQLTLERTALPFLGIRTGDRVLVQADGRVPVPMTVSGAVHDGGVAPAGQEQTAYGYVTTDALARLGAPSTVDQLKLVTAVPDTDRIAQDVARTLAAQGHPVSRIEIPPPLRHPHQGQMETVGWVLLAFGISALLLSSTLVATMLGGMLAAQIRQIGAMKAVGARTGQILSMYLLETAAIAIVATGLAVAPGLWLGRVLARQGAGLLNLDLVDSGTPGWVLAVVLLAGVGVPLLVALVPVVRASRVTVRRAIDDHGVSEAGNRWLAKVRGLALRNLFRRPGRLALSVGLLAVAGSMFLTGLDTAGGWSALVAQGIDNRHYDIEVRLPGPQPADRLTAIARTVPGVTDAQAWGSAPTTVHVPGRVDVSRVYPDDSHASFTVLAPPADTGLVRLPLLAGRWLRADDTDAVVLNNLVPAQQAPEIAVGAPITLTVAGRVVIRHVVGIVSDFGTQGTAYLTDHEYAAITGGAGVGMLRVVTAKHDTASRQAVLAALETRLAADGIPVAEDLTVDTLKAALDGHVLVLADALIAIAVMVGFVGLLGLASSMGTSVVERTREFGVLHAIGATAGTVRHLVVAEGVLTGALSLVVALAVTVPLTRIFGDFIGTQAFRQPLPYHFSVAALVLWTVLTVSGAALASTGAAWRASRLTVREALSAL